VGTGSGADLPTFEQYEAERRPGRA
jgi:hypothetical protein